MTLCARAWPTHAVRLFRASGLMLESLGAHDDADPVLQGQGQLTLSDYSESPVSCCRVSEPIMTSTLSFKGMAKVCHPRTEMFRCRTPKFQFIVQLDSFFPLCCRSCRTADRVSNLRLIYWSCVPCLLFSCSLICFLLTTHSQDPLHSCCFVLLFSAMLAFSQQVME